ncbi:hypothetical protein [Sorangium sp. So ce131]|uniref:hypothetical protein n=1 Tax=Sorangium sp. So ce131 TaxID=3133282 RepID=UPI003F60338B
MTADLQAFARTVNAVAADMLRTKAPGTFGEHKAFISEVGKQPEFRGLKPADFKAQVLKCQRQGLVDLSRADLVEVMPAQMVKESAVTHLSTEWHFVRIDDLRAAPPRATAGVERSRAAKPAPERASAARSSRAPAAAPESLPSRGPYVEQRVDRLEAAVFGARAGSAQQTKESPEPTKRSRRTPEERATDDAVLSALKALSKGNVSDRKYLVGRVREKVGKAASVAAFEESLRRLEAAREVVVSADRSAVRLRYRGEK